MMNNAVTPQLTIQRVARSVSLNLFGDVATDKMKLEDWFIVPPFSILNSSTKEWQQKKRDYHNGAITKEEYVEWKLQWDYK